jgi:hypothetical protein
VATAAAPEERGDDLEIIAVIAAAIAAMGESGGRISVIRRLDGTAWTQVGRLDAVNARTQMY